MVEAISQKEKIISYLTFCLGAEHFALNVGRVVNILEMQSITKVPKSPNYIPGIINLRGEVLPVIDTNIKLGLGTTQTSSNTCILVIETEVDKSQIRFGMLVDSVQEVVEIEDANILPSPTIGENYNTEIISGVVESEERFVMILHINKLLSYNEVLNLKQINKNKK